MPLRTVQRYVNKSLRADQWPGPNGPNRRRHPSDECQIDFGRKGLLFDPDTGRRRTVYALPFTACYSRHQFLWLSFGQTTEAVIDGCEAARAISGGIFRTVVPDNMSAIVDGADAIEPRLNQAFVEYAQARGFHVDPTYLRVIAPMALDEPAAVPALLGRWAFTATATPRAAVVVLGVAAQPTLHDLSGARLLP